MKASFLCFRFYLLFDVTVAYCQCSWVDFQRINQHVSQLFSLDFHVLRQLMALSYSVGPSFQEDATPNVFRSDSCAWRHRRGSVLVLCQEKCVAGGQGGDRVGSVGNAASKWRQPTWRSAVKHRQRHKSQWPTGKCVGPRGKYYKHFQFVGSLVSQYSTAEGNRQFSWWGILCFFSYITVLRND